MYVQDTRIIDVSERLGTGKTHQTEKLLTIRVNFHGNYQDINKKLVNPYASVLDLRLNAYICHCWGIGKQLQDVSLQTVYREC